DRGHVGPRDRNSEVAPAPSSREARAPAEPLAGVGLMSERLVGHRIDDGTCLDPGREPAAALLVELLGDATTWLDPRPSFEDAVVGAVGAVRARRRKMRRL